MSRHLNHHNRSGGGAKTGNESVSSRAQGSNSSADDATGEQGLSDFTPETQDLIAVEILRVIKVAENIKSGDINAALDKASHRWSALPQGKGKPGYYPKQPSVSFESFESNYLRFGGTIK